MHSKFLFAKRAATTTTTTTTFMYSTHKWTMSGYLHGTISIRLNWIYSRKCSIRIHMMYAWVSVHVKVTRKWDSNGNRPHTDGMVNKKNCLSWHFMPRMSCRFSLEIDNKWKWLYRNKQCMCECESFFSNRIKRVKNGSSFSSCH